MFDQLDTFLQQQAKLAEEDFKKSLLDVLNEWDKKSYEVIDDINSLLTTAKDDFEHSVNRVNTAAQNLQDNLGILSNNEAISAETNQLLKNFIAAYTEFCSFEKNILNNINDALFQEITPSLANVNQKLNNQAIVFQEYKQSLEFWNTKFSDFFEKINNAISQNSDHNLKHKEITLAIKQINNDTSNYLGQFSTQTNASMNNLITRIEEIGRSNEESIKLLQQNLELTKAKIGKVQSMLIISLITLIIIGGAILYSI